MPLTSQNYWIWVFDGQSSLWPSLQRFCIFSRTVKCQAARDFAQDFGKLFNEFLNRFIIAGNWNAHNKFWGCSRSSPRGVQLLDHITSSSLQVLAAGGPTHFSSDARKNPTAFDFAIYKGISFSLYINQMNLGLTTFRLKYFYALLLRPNLQHQSCCPTGLTLDILRIILQSLLWITNLLIWVVLGYWCWC